MRIDPNLLIAAKLIHDECVNNAFSCVGCQLQDICEHTSMPDEWRIPDPPPEPTERPRIEWLRVLPDKEMLNATNTAGFKSMSWWHKVVIIEQFRKDVGLK